MSAARPIELLDNDDVVDLESDKEKAVLTFLEFSGSKDRIKATEWLQRFDFNVETALMMSMEGTVDPVVTANDQEGHHGLIKPISKPQVSLVCENKCHDDSNEEPLLSITWYDYMASVETSASMRFIDPDFPPNQSSLDGRKQTSEPDQDIKCVCGIPAAAKSVQSDGPNYGRFYLCCGKPRQRGNARSQCQFFQWDDHNGSKGAAYATRYSIMAWEFFGSVMGQHSLVKDGFSPDDVRQGAVGNCWFLSALAVVAEKKYLVRKLLPHTVLNEKGCYQVNLCLDGKWTPIIVDSYLPVVHGRRIVDPLRRGGDGEGPAQLSNRAVSSIHPAFCAVPNGQLWAALIEKAYAKAHGSYQQLSGGFIHEGFQDMTGAPTETLLFDDNVWDVESLWARLLSCYEAGFLMGVATSKGGDGLVGGHAYSVLEVIEINDVFIGEQQRITNFLNGSTLKKKQRTTVRLVRIRNPWGKKEWKGEWSVSSEQWTKAMRNRLGGKSYAKGDGTFFMSYQDMLQRFHHMDVVKCCEGWEHVSADGCFTSRMQDPFHSSTYYFTLSVKEKTFAFLSVMQPKKRSNTKSQYWYTDVSMIILKRTHIGGEWDIENMVICGRMRSCTLEVFLDPMKEYVVLPFSLMAHGESEFRIVSYSAKHAEIGKLSRDKVGCQVALSHLHRYLLKDERKLVYGIAVRSVLISVHGDRCLYFLVVNASQDHILSVRLCVTLQKGLSLSHGVSGDVCDVPPRSQRIAMVVSSDGIHSPAVALEFSYATDTIPSNKDMQTLLRGSALNAPIEISIAGDLLASAVDADSARNKGGDAIETHQWLSQIGAHL